MNRMASNAAALGLAWAFTVLGCNSTAPPPASTQAADEAAVRQADENWSKAAQAKQVDPWVAFYSDDAVLLPPNEHKAIGKESVRKVIGELLALPGVSVSWEPQKVEVARSGELAYTQGRYELSSTGAHGKASTDQGKTVEIWKKQSDGSWKCAVDMWSSDLPVPQ